MARRGENIYKRKDGRYEGRYIKRRTADGKPVYGYLYARSYSEIKALLLKYKSSPKTDTSDNMRLGDWLKIWLDAQNGIKVTTKSIYKGHMENHILPALGKYPLKKLSREILQAFADGLTISPSTVKTVFATLKTALSAAEEKGYISNVWKNVKMPKAAEAAVRILSVGEQRKLEAVLKSKEDIGILMSLYMGIRIGEVCALRWENIDFEENAVYICGTQSRTRDGVGITSPKSKSSNRKIPIPSVLISELSGVKHKVGFVVSNTEKAYDVRSYRRLFKARLAEAGIPDIKYHALRHTFATRALEVGMDYRTLSEILGHSSAAITLNLYAHSLDEHKRKEMDKLSHIFN